MGHGGNLDETATGVLVIGVGLGCKLLPNFLHGEKSYLVKACLGIETDTLNGTGNITNEMPYSHITANKLREKCLLFQGEVMQIPPKFSALKIGGKRMADLTRSGIDVPVKPREVVCYSVKLLDFTPPIFTLEVLCGGGFYVRSLIRDLGHALGSCAHVVEIHRTKHGFLTDADAIERDNFTYDKLLDNAQQVEKKSEFRRLLRRLM